MQIYLDYSATTPTRPEAIATMQTVMTATWGNPSSLHHWGNRAATHLEQARSQVADLLHAGLDQVVFTAGGTEADNLAILGITQRYDTPQHVITSSVEHAAIAQTLHRLEQQGWQVTYLPVDTHGCVDPATLTAAIQANTVLISIIFGQSEIGTLQPIAALGHIARAHSIPFHTDAVQVAGRLPIDVRSLPVDLLSLSSHKIYGPQGAGALYIHPDVALQPLMGGGGQELGLRPGTQAVPILAGFGVAAALATQEMPTETVRLIHLRDRLFAQLADVPDLIPTGHPRSRLPHHVSFYLDSADGDRLSGKTLVRQMNLAGIGISAGSACHSGKLTPSPVLKALGLSDRAAKSGIRLTLGRRTTLADVDWTAMVLKQILARVRPELVTR